MAVNSLSADKFFGPKNSDCIGEIEMDIDTLLSSLLPEDIDRLNYAVETGHWPDGPPITDEQRDNAMQVVMLYQSRHNLDAQHMTIGIGGDITIKSKIELKKAFPTDMNLISSFPLNQKS